jgi:multiple sugar transport system ATP-binding protein
MTRQNQANWYLIVAKVVVENVYKSYPRRRAEQELAPVTAEALVPSPSVVQIEQSEQSSNRSSQVNILRNINLAVEDSEFMVLVGPSGCGKSTLLRLIAGLETLTGGNIWIGDRLVNQLPPKERDIAMVFQNYALYPHLNVYDNIAFGLRRTLNQSSVGAIRESPVHQAITKDRSGFSDLVENLLVGTTRSLPKRLRYLSAKEKEISQRVRYVAQLLQIESFLTRLPKELSGGQKQRVALGRAIARNPQVFLMDEPLSNLDAKLRAQTRAQIVQLQRQLGTTAIYVTHDQTEAMTMGDRIAVMNRGQIQQIAPPLEIYHRPANRFVAEFIGSPPMNFLQVQFVPPLTIAHPQFRLNLPENWAVPLQNYRERSLWLGIRPEHFNLIVPGEHHLSVVVDLVEALGNETYLSVHLTEEVDSTLQVKIPPDRFVNIGETIYLSIDLEKIHLFAADTEESLLVKT